MAQINRERLALAMSEMGLSQAELARRASISPAAVQQLLNGTTKTTRSMREVADALEVSREWLEGLSDNRHSELVITKDPADGTVQSIPYSATFDGQAKLKFLKISGFWLDHISSNTEPSRLVMSIITSGAMAPTLMPGDNVLVKLATKYDGNPNSIWFIEINGEGAYRRVRETATGFMLTGDNPIVAPVEMAPNEVGFHGEVIWQGRKIEQ